MVLVADDDVVKVSVGLVRTRTGRVHKGWGDASGMALLLLLKIDEMGGP
jgi:hypothetical protein